MSPRNALAGIALAVGACACFAALDTATKVVGAALPLFMTLWVRYAFHAVATTVVVMPARGWPVWHTRHPGLQSLRGLLLLTSSGIAFASLKYMPVGEFTAIVMITPLVVTLLAAKVLKEHVSPLRWACVAGGFAGTVVILRPGDEAFTPASLLPLGLVVTNSSFHLITTRLARTEDPVTMQLYTGWTGALVCSLALPFVWTTPEGWTPWALLAFIAVAGSVGHFLLILAFHKAPASTLTPFMYSQIAFATLGGWLVFRHVPDVLSLAGILVIAACGVGGAWLTVREHRAQGAG